MSSKDERDKVAHKRTRIHVHIRAHGWYTIRGELVTRGQLKVTVPEPTRLDTKKEKFIESFDLTARENYS